MGKTHLAIALALRAIDNGFGAYFVRAYDLMEDLRKARNEHNLDRRMKVYLAPKVLVVDEFGIWPYDREAATAFFTLVSARYERGSIILTSNKGFGEWGELLGDTVCQGRRQNIPVGRSKSVPPERSLASVNVRASCSGEVSQRQAGSKLGG